MNTDTLIRETLTNRAESYDLSLASVGEIAGAAGRRTRRSRLAGGATALTLAALMIVGIGFAHRSAEPSTLMFAGIDSAGSAETPTTILATDDGWLGATLVFADERATQAEVGEVYLATSTDGESWELAQPTGVTSASATFALDEHDGRYWLAVSDGTVQLAFSDNLIDWQRVALPAEAIEFSRELRAGWLRTITPAKLVASNAGIMLKIDAAESPDFEALIGRKLDNVCDLRWHVAYTEARVCGMSEFERYDAPESTELIQPRGGDSNLVFSADGETFAVFSLDTGSTTRLPYSSGQRLYETDDGFGLADYLLSESIDGTSWARFDAEALERLTSPSFAAMRDGQRLAASESFAAPEAEVLLSDDGKLWTTHSLGELVDLRDPSDRPAEPPTYDERGARPAFTPQFTITSLVSGDAGWAVAGWTRSSDGRDFMPMQAHETAPLSVTVGDYTLTGTLPAGPAELIDADGVIVREFDAFEPRTPWRTGVNDDGADLNFVDDQGDTIVSISIADWRDQVNPGDAAWTYLVLFSPNGADWSKIHEGSEVLADVSVGDDEVVIATRTQQGTASQRIAVGDGQPD